MAGLSKVTVSIGSGGLGRRAANQDKISGLLFYNDTLPASFGITDRYKKVYSLDEAELLGIAEGSADHAVEWYHISEYFRGNPDGELWIGYNAILGTGIISDYTHEGIDAMQRASSGEIRLMGVYTTGFAFNITELTKVQGIVDTLISDGMPLSVLYAGNVSAVTAITGWATVGDARGLACRSVTPVVSQDGGGAGLALFTSKAYSITTLGHTLGFLSRAKVNQSIGNPENFNASNGTELETIALANGDLVSDLSDVALAGIKDDGYQIAIKRTPKMSGTYYERTPTATPFTDDFAWAEFSRTVDKAVRLVDSALTPKLLSGVSLKSDGTLNNDTVDYFNDISEQALSGMLSEGEVSGIRIDINPLQNVQSTSTLTVVVSVQPTPIAEFINVKIGLAATL
jgi:hypothetical protein